MKDYNFKDITDTCAKCYNGEISVDDAIKKLRKINSQHPYELARIEIAKLEIKRGNISKAKDMLQKIYKTTNVKDFKENALYVLATIDTKEGNIEAAEEKRELLTRESHQKSVDYKLARTYCLSGDKKEAKKRFEDILENETNMGAIYHLAHMAIENKDFEKAEEYANELHNHEDYDAETFIRAYTLYAQNEFKDAKLKFQSLYGTKYGYDSKYRVATIEFKEGDNNLAMQLLSELHDTPLNSVARIYEGIILDSEGFHEEALSTYLDVLNVDKKIDQHVYVSIANALSNLGRYDEARKYLDMVTDGNLPSAVYYKICNDIYESKYMNALKKIDEYQEIRDYKGTQIWYYVYTKIFDKKNDIPESYFFKQVRKHKDKQVIDHIEKHLEIDESKPVHTTFYNNVDIHDLYFYAREVIKSLDFSYKSFNDFYILKADYPIASIHGAETSYMCVVTLPGTKDIITMYPMIVSKYYLDRHNDAGRSGIEG
ncbi:MAG: hypothetical protein K6G37_01560 [Bacilli bacterium]|nr:hypothetical protein [Bacilli bacterium]